MLSRYVIFEIRVYPLVRKFLAHHYATGPFPLNCTSNSFASYLYACLERYNHFDTRIPRKYDRLTDTLTVGISPWVERYGNGSKLTPAKVGAFNDFVRQRFFETMAQEMAMRTAFGMGVKEAAQRFLLRYGITEDDLPLDIALRYYARYRRALLIEYCPDSRAEMSLKLPHDGGGAQWKVEPGRGQVA